MTDIYRAEGKNCYTDGCLHPASETYADSVLDWAHGHVTFYCKCCLLKKHIDMAESMAKNLPAWREELQTACEEE